MTLQSGGEKTVHRALCFWWYNSRCYSTCIHEGRSRGCRCGESMAEELQESSIRNCFLHIWQMPGWFLVFEVCLGSREALAPLALEKGWYLISVLCGVVAEDSSCHDPDTYAKWKYEGVAWCFRSVEDSSSGFFVTSWKAAQEDIG